VLKEHVAIAFENLVEHNPGVRAAHQFCQFALALLERHSPQIFTLEFDQIESDQNRNLAVAMIYALSPMRSSKIGSIFGTLCKNWNTTSALPITGNNLHMEAKQLVCVCANELEAQYEE